MPEPLVYLSLIWLALFVISATLLVKSFKKRIPLQIFTFLICFLFTGYQSVARIVLFIQMKNMDWENNINNHSEYLNKADTVVCGIDKLSNQDSGLLQDFCIQLKNAINDKDKEKLAALFNFPFYCDPCNDFIKIKGEEGFITVTKQLFIDSLYMAFFTPYLIETINQGNIFDMLHTENNIDQKTCSYFFWLSPHKAFCYLGRLTRIYFNSKN